MINFDESESPKCEGSKVGIRLGLASSNFGANINFVLKVSYIY